MGKDQSTNGGGLNRRQFLGVGAGAAAGMLLAACGGSSTPPGAGGQASDDLFGTGVRPWFAEDLSCAEPTSAGLRPGMRLLMNHLQPLDRHVCVELCGC